MRSFRRFLRERPAVIGSVAVLILLIAAVFGPIIDATPPNVVTHDLIGFPQAPSAAHWFGTDLIGRDIFVRALYGARVSLLVGAAAMVVSFSIGILYGAIAGATGGIVDNLMMRFVDAMLSFPTFFLLLIISALTNKFSLSIIILIIGLTSWPGLARLVRAEVLSLRERDFVEAARALGAGPVRLILRHLIPNALAPVVVAAAFAIGDNILAESSLSFFGLGVQPPSASWGNMLQDALTPQAEAAPWMVLVPGLAIVATVLAFSVIADGIRVALDTSIGQETGDIVDVEPAPYAGVWQRRASHVPNVTRRSSIGIGLGMFALSATRPVIAQTLPTVRVATISSDIFGEPFYGQDVGLFKRAGLNVELSVFTNSGAVGTAVAAHAADVGVYDVVGTSAAVEQNVPITMFAAGSQFATSTPTAMLCVSKASTLRAPRDFAGKTIAVSTLHGLSDAATRAWLTRAGVSIADIKIVEIPFPQMAASLERGTIDGAVIAEPFLSAAKIAGERAVGNIFDAIAPSFYQTGWIASPDYLSANPDIARKLVDAVYAIGRWANAHHAESGGIIAKYAKLDDATARAMTRTAYATALDYREIQPLLDVAATYGLIKRPIKAAEIVTVIR